MHVPRHVPAYCSNPISNDPTYTWHSNSARGGYQALYTAYDHPGALILDQSTESLHATLAQIIAEVKGLAAHVTGLCEMEAKAK